MSVVERFDRYQRSHRWLSFPIAVIYKFVDDQGTYLTALMTYYAFLAVLPLLLLSTTILSFVLESHPHLLQEVLNSAVGQFPVVGSQLSDPRGVSGSGIGLALGLLGTIYGCLGFAQAIQNSMNTIWRVPRHRRPNPIRSRLRGLLLLGAVATAGGCTSAITILGANFHEFAIGVAILIEFGTFVVNSLLFAAVFRVATARDVTFAQSWRGAVGAAFVWQFLQLAATEYVRHVVKHATATNGVFALVLGLIAWLYVQSLVVVLAVEANSVRADQLYPRALLTIFTDDVELTDADRESYADQAEAQQAKGFQKILVSFDDPDEPVVS